jgi:WD40 repeat protein
MAAVWDANSCTVLYPLSGHKARVETAQFSADGRKAITASNDGFARIWPTPTGSEATLLAMHDRPVDRVMFSPDGAYILSATYRGSVKVSDAKEGTLIFGFDHGDDLESVSYTPDGRRIVTSSDAGPTRLWDAATGAELKQFGDQLSQTVYAAFSRSGAVFASAEGAPISETGVHLVRLRDANTGALRKTVAAYEDDEITGLALSEDGKRLAVGLLSGHVELWNLEREQNRIAGKHGDWINSVAFSRDASGSRLVTGSRDRTAKVWDSGTGAEHATLIGHHGYVERAGFNRDGRLVVTSAGGADADTMTAIWDAEAGNWINFAVGLVSADISPDGRRLAGAYTGQNRAGVWEFDFPFGPKLMEAAYALLTDALRREVERERIRYWGEVDPRLLE